VRAAKRRLLIHLATEGQAVPGSFEYSLILLFSFPSPQGFYDHLSMCWITPYPFPQTHPNVPRYREHQRIGIGPRASPRSLISLPTSQRLGLVQTIDCHEPYYLWIAATRESEVPHQVLSPLMEHILIRGHFDQPGAHPSFLSP
jgi:hypothetical protein